MLTDTVSEHANMYRCNAYTCMQSINLKLATVAFKVSYRTICEISAAQAKTLERPKATKKSITLAPVWKCWRSSSCKRHKLP